MSPDLEFHLLRTRCREIIAEAQLDMLASELAAQAAPGPSLLDRLRRLLWHPGLAKRPAKAMA
jgi:hypothetical protein